ncbi:MAG: hypothetical protein RL758_2291 [Pseudomonadota bacterium]|jgi:hypothetical protein
MEVRAQRPRLVSMRVVQFHGDNQVLANPPQVMQLSLEQDIQVGLGVSNDEHQRLLALVDIRLTAKAVPQVEGVANPEFFGTYEGKFEFPEGMQELDVVTRFDTEPYQYVLVAQVVPLAMTHFRRELQAMGVDARELPLGI